MSHGGREGGDGGREGIDEGRQRIRTHENKREESFYTARVFPLFLRRFFQAPSLLSPLLTCENASKAFATNFCPQYWHPLSCMISRAHPFAPLHDDDKEEDEDEVEEYQEEEDVCAPHPGPEEGRR